ncbi:RHS repeat-associated core domain-containing protein [Actinoplanes sp. NPDC051851]|uniref:RHS repeat-associated core domain-containing protein n=1 Tax=Actinoplanes sp. NPDC051851 TaxID=3154753 RepID=UPI00342843CE
MSSDLITVQVFEPNGTPVLWDGGDGYSYPRTWAGLPGGDLDFTTSFAGTYTVLLGTEDLATGSITVTASAPVAAGALTLGTAKSVSIPRPGQDAIVTFAGTANQALSLSFASYTPAYLPRLTLTGPDGTVLAAGYVDDLWVDLPTLPSTGTYTLRISPYSSSGTFSLTLLERQSAGALSLTGAGTTVTFGTAGRSADATLAGTAGQEITFAFSGWTLPATGSLRVRITDPAGTPVIDGAVGSLQTFRYTTAVTGTYRTTLTPLNGATGAVTVTVSPVQAGGALAIGTAKTTSSPRVGQATRLTLAGTAGQRISLYLSTYTYTYAVWATLTQPSGATVFSGWLTDYWAALGALPATGTYQLVLEPVAQTGTLVLTPYEGIDAGATTIGGAAKTLTAPSANRYADTTFTVTAGQRLSMGFTGWTFASTSIWLRLVDPSGTVLLDGYVSSSYSVDTRALAAAGTYRLSVMAADRGAGAVALTLSQQVNGGSFTLGTAKTITASRVGQSTYVTYAGTAGQTLALTLTSVTMPYYPYVIVRNPDGSVLASLSGNASVTIPALPTTGTYELLIGPYSYTGTAVATLVTRTAAASGDDAYLSPYARRSAPGELTGTTAGAAPKAAAVPHRTLRKPATRKEPRAGLAATDVPPGTTAGESWKPTSADLDGQGWNTGRGFTGSSPEPLRAAAATTAVSGRVLNLQDRPLSGVTVTIEGVTARTDENGRFLLAGVKPGHRVLRVDGGADFGLYDIGVDASAGQTTVLSYPIWLSRLDREHTVTFPSPTTGEVTITTPAIPGLEVRLPAGAVVRDTAGRVVTELGITAIPVDRTPFPLPRSQVPSYFTVQPGSAYVFPEGARVIYPNFTHARPGATMDFWHYDPEGKGWFVYGTGTVTADGKQVVPDEGTEVYRFTGAMLITPGAAPPPDVAPQPGGGAYDADPVDLGTGLLVDRHTDLTVDDVVPLDLTRTYQQNDTGKRAFGVGVNFTYGLDLYSENRFYECWLILPDGGRIRFHRISDGGAPPNGYLNSVLAADPTPTEFAGSVLAWNGDGWDLRLSDGTTYIFGDESPLQAIRDRYGNTVTITRAPSEPWVDGITRARGPITQVTSPNGKWIRFTYDAEERVTRAEDVLGRSVGYTYDSAGHLATVTDVNGGVTTYAYGSGLLTTIKDPRGTTYLTNEYDANGRVTRQTMPGGATYALAYTTDATGRVTATQLTDPRGHTRRVEFNGAGYLVSDTAAHGTASARTVVITRDATTNLPTAYTDALNRRTELTYDAYGNITAVTELAGSGHARTTTIARAGPYDQVTGVTDALGHTGTYGYQADGALHTAADALGRTVTLTTDESGRPTAVTDAAGKTTTVGYLLGDPATVTDPLGNVTRAFTDGAGQVRRVTDAQGNVSAVAYEPSGQPATTTDPLGRTVSLAYDANGNLRTVTDARQHTTTYAYDTSDRLITVTDPLNRATTLTYDTNGNVVGRVGASGTRTTYRYDDLDRLDLVRYGVTSDTAQESSTAITYDAGDRVRTVADSAGGTTTVTPDDFDQPVTVVSPGGTVGYAYDGAGRRTTMSAGGEDTGYAYNDADQLVSVTRGAQSAAVGYDTAGRRASVTLPGSIAQVYAYDDASRLTGITYQHGGTVLGNIAYTLDAVGQPVRLAGSYARVALPEEYGPVAYDAADQVGGDTYDADGNLTSDGAATYTWNARGELTGYDTPSLSVDYGYDGLGRRSSRSTGGTTTGYLFDGLNAVRESVAGTVTASSLTGGLDEVFARTTEDGTQALLTDALGSTVATAAAGTVGAEYTYDPFGATTVEGDDAGNTVRFTGREDEGEGLYYYRNRYYSTARQRFLSRDPLGLASGDTNPYAYVYNQPTTLVDPMGTKPQGSCGSPNSFAAGTPVLMADGTTKPIEQVHPGDRVLAGDPSTGERSAQTVTAHITGNGDKTLIAVTTTDGGTLTATDGHPFWVDRDGDPSTPGGDWVDAAELRQGQWLRTSDGRLVRVAGTHALRQFAYAHNLTVANLHTYYVLAAATPILVHNTDYPTATQLRNSPGVASGGENLPFIRGQWLRGSHGNAGMLPAQIADQLRGRSFSDFGEFREAFWRAVGNDPALSSQFKPSGQSNMRNGKSPWVAEIQQYRGATRYSLHHVVPISQGGGVYDLGNLVVVTPRYHADILDPDYHGCR